MDSSPDGEIKPIAEETMLSFGSLVELRSALLKVELTESRAPSSPGRFTRRITLPNLAPQFPLFRVALQEF